MAKNGIQTKRKRKFRTITDSNQKFRINKNLLIRNFKVEKPNEVWFSDITYIWTDEG